MAASKFKIQFFFQTNKGLPASWSETFYLTNGDGIDSVANSLSTTDLVGRRLQMLHNDFSMYYVRITDTELRNSSRVVGIPQPGGTGQYREANASIGTAEEVHVALMCRMEGTSIHRRSLMLHGIPEGVVDGERVFQEANGFWVPYFNGWRNQVKTGGPTPLQIRTRTVSDPIPVTSIILPADGRTLAVNFVEDPTGNGIDIGSYILLKNCTGADNINGLHRVANILSNIAVTSPQKRRMYGGPVIPGTVQLVTYALTSITNIIPQEGRIHELGQRGYSPLRGRR